jgi:hypothetical protein
VLQPTRLCKRHRKGHERIFQKPSELSALGKLETLNKENSYCGSNATISILKLWLKSGKQFMLLDEGELP